MTVVVYQDAVHIQANGAFYMIEIDKDPKAWAAAAAQEVAALLNGPLRIRIRHTLFRKRPTGAIYLRHGDGGHWNGDLAAITGAGETFTFENWFVPVSRD